MKIRTKTSFVENLTWYLSADKTEVQKWEAEKKNKKICRVKKLGLTGLHKKIRCKSKR